MTMQEVIDEVKYEVDGGGVLELELEDQEIERGIKKALRELTRYWDETTLIKAPFSSCITLGEDVSSVVRVYRTEGSGNADGASMYDPMYAQQWMMFSNGGTMYNLSDYMANYAAWSTLQGIKNTLSTELSFEEDRHNNKLYINNGSSKPSYITISYIPKLTDPTQIKSDYWIDILIRMSVALTKITLGRIRTRYTQSGALWTQDGEKLLEEGNTDLKELRETLRVNSNLNYGMD